MKIFADDSFSGIILFKGTVFEMKDKMAHFLAGATITHILLALSRWLNIDLTNLVLAVILLAVFVGWEILEFVRLWLNNWEYGVATDYISWRDIVADIAGAVVVFVLTKV